MRCGILLITERHIGASLGPEQQGGKKERNKTSGALSVVLLLKVTTGSGCPHVDYHFPLSLCEVCVFCGVALEAFAGASYISMCYPIQVVNLGATINIATCSKLST